MDHTNSHYVGCASGVISGDNGEAGSTILQVDQAPPAESVIPVTSQGDAFSHAAPGVEQRLRELLLLNRVIAAASSSLEPDAVMEIVCKELAMAFHLQQAAFALLDNERRQLTVTAEYRAPAGRLPSMPSSPSPTTRPHNMFWSIARPWLCRMRSTIRARL